MGIVSLTPDKILEPVINGALEEESIFFRGDFFFFLPGSSPFDRPFTRSGDKTCDAQLGGSRKGGFLIPKP